jgi:hypothetical protein
MVHLGDEAQVEACLGSFGVVLIRMQDWCTVSVKCAISSEIILDRSDRTPRWRGSCGISLQSVGDNVRVGAR